MMVLHVQCNPSCTQVYPAPILLVDSAGGSKAQLRVMVNPAHASILIVFCTPCCVCINQTVL